MAQKEQCFIITPIGDDTDPIRRHIEGVIDAAITPALGEEYDIVVAHKIGEPGSITKQVIDKVYHSKLVIANLTNRNPNVMYELALRHAIGKPVIMIAERGTPLPSDIIMQRTIFYYNDAKGVLELRNELKKAACEIDFENKAGPFAETLGILMQDTDMPKNDSGTWAERNQSIEQIVQQLNRLEEQLPGRYEQIDKNQNANNIYCVKITYDSRISSRFYGRRLIDFITGASYSESISILDIHDNEEQKKIINSCRIGTDYSDFRHFIVRLLNVMRNDSYINLTYQIL